MKVTIFKDSYDSANPYFIELDKIFLAIRNGSRKTLIEKLRSLPPHDQLTPEGKKEKERLKKQLPSICFSGIFSHRANARIESHTGLIVIDFDHVKDYQILWDRLISDPYTHMAFRSPSGDGIKLVVKIPASVETHAKSCRALEEYYKEGTFDKLEDVARICYMSYDPDIYWCQGSVEFTEMRDEAVKKPKNTKQTVTEVVLDADEIYSKLKVWAEKYETYVDGNKHRFAVKFAAACNRFGLPINVAGTRFTCDYKDMASAVDPRDFEKIFSDVYKNYGSQHGTAVFERERLVDKITNNDVSKDILDTTLPIKDIITVNDVRDSMLINFSTGSRKGETTYFPSVDTHWTWKKGELTLLGGILNHGKTCFLMQLCIIKSIKEGVKWAVFSPEQNPPDDFYDDLIHTYIGKNTQKHFADQMSTAEYKRGMDFVNEHFYYVYPQDDAPTPKYIDEKFVELIAKKNVSGCIVDPYNQLDNDMGKVSREDMYISSFLTRQKRFALDHDVYHVIVAHPHSMGKKKDDGNYGCPDVYDFNGGAMWGNKCDNVLQIYRPYYTTDQLNTETTFFSQKIKKQRLIGIPGEATLYYNKATGRYYDGGYNAIEHQTQTKLIEIEQEPLTWDDKIPANTSFYEKTDETPF